VATWPKTSSLKGGPKSSSLNKEKNEANGQKAIQTRQIEEKSLEKQDEKEKIRHEASREFEKLMNPGVL